MVTYIQRQLVTLQSTSVLYRTYHMYRIVQYLYFLIEMLGEWVEG